MEEVYERIRELRKNHLHMSQTEFGDRLGVSRSVINNIERNALARPDQKLSLIKLICKEFSVSEDWLLRGIEPPFIVENAFTLDSFVKQHQGTDLEIEIIKSYFDMDVGVRRYLMEHFRKTLLRKEDAPAADAERADDDSELEAIHDDTPDTEEELQRLYPLVDPDYREAK